MLTTVFYSVLMSTFPDEQGITSLTESFSVVMTPSLMSEGPGI